MLRLSQRPAAIPMSDLLVETISLGSVSLSITRPAGPDDVVRSAEAAGEPAEAGYWATPWPSAMALGEVLASTPLLGPGVQVLEIGCGLGICGLVAAACGAKVTLTDVAPRAVELAAENARRNGLDDRCRTALLDWASPPGDLAADVVIGADVLYRQTAHRPIARLVQWLGAAALLADPYRSIADQVPATFGQLGLTVRQERLGKGVRVFLVQ